MSRIRPEEVREIATLARLQLSEPEIQKMTNDLDAILEYVATLSELPVDNVPAMTHAVPFDCPLRTDEVRPSLPLDEALKNAPRREGNFFQVPRIIAAGPGGGEEAP